MKFINYSEFRIIKDYQKLQKKKTLYGESHDNTQFKNRVNDFKYNTLYDFIWINRRTRKVRLDVSIRKSRRTLSYIIRNKGKGSIRTKVFASKMKDKRFSVIFRRHLRDIGWFKKKR